MDWGKSLRMVSGLEKELHVMRSEVLKAQRELAELEKRLFTIENKLEHEMVWQFEHARRLEGQTLEKARKLKQSLLQKIKKLSANAKAEKLSNAVLEQQLLQRELETLQVGFKKELEQARKKK